MRKLTPSRNTRGKVLSAIFTGILGCSVAFAANAQTVSTEPALRSAFNSALPGTVIVVADGTYMLTDRLLTQGGGTAANPIIVRSANRHGAVIVSNGAEEAFQVQHPWWRFEG